MEKSKLPLPLSRANIIVIVVFLYTYTSHQTVSAEYKEIVWRNLEEFLEGGWEYYTATTGFDKPSLINSTFAPLDEGSSDGVWVKGTYFDFRYDQLNSPKFCERTFANITIKLYNTDSVRIFPCLNWDDPRRKCYNTPPPTSLTWVTKEVGINLSELGPVANNRIWLGGIWSNENNGGRMANYIIDEVRLKHDGKDCTCNHDCEYVGIDCFNYYTCINFEYKEFHKCPSGLAFNPNSKICDLLENVPECQLSTTEPPLTTTPPPENCICEYRSDVRNCSNYYFCPDICQLGLCERRSCPEGLLWTVDLHGDGSNHQQCTFAQNATCAGRDPTVEFSCHLKPDGRYMNTRDCRSFWKCFEGMPILYECPKNKVYDIQVDECVNEENVDIERICH